MYSLGKQSLTNLNGVLPELVRVIEKAIINFPCDFSVTAGVRTYEQQHALWLKGRDPITGKVINPKLVVTNDDGGIKKSNHQLHADGFGHAVDINPFINGEIDWNDTHKFMQPLAKHILNVGSKMGLIITWGGNWTIAKEGIVDPDHFEVR